MDSALEARIGKLVARRLRNEMAEDRLKAAAPDELRAAHDQVVSQIPAALSRLSSAVDEMNDAISDTNIRLKLEPIEEPYSIAASFRVSVRPSDDRQRGLVFNVNHDGQLIALLASSQSRMRLKTVLIAEADKTFFLEAIVSLLEAVA